MAAMNFQVYLFTEFIWQISESPSQPILVSMSHPVQSITHAQIFLSPNTRILTAERTSFFLASDIDFLNPIQADFESYL